MPVRRYRLPLLALLTALSIAPAGPASAQGLFDFLFGRREPLPPRTSSYADPMDLPRGVSTRAVAPVTGGRQAAFCVRLCDGRYFPVSHRAGATPVQLCHAACPASETKVLSGRAIDHAVAADGSRYASLKNAYVYRDRLVDNCTCNGRDAFGLAPIDVTSDPTLRPGDTVATAGGLMSYNGRRDSAAQFTPVDPEDAPKTLRGKFSGETAPEAEAVGATDAAYGHRAQDATTGIVEGGFSTVLPGRHAQFVR